MFEKAARLKVRFDSSKGPLSVEDLWDLPLTSARGPNLNDIAKGINRELKASSEEDFVSPATKADELSALKFGLVKHVISVRLAENEESRTVADKKVRKDKLLEIISRKQDQALEGASLEDLHKMVEAL